MIRSFVITVAALLIATSAYAQRQTFYVATTGSDTNNGTSYMTPFLTIQHAVDTAGTLPVTIYVRAGSYAENVVVIHPGSFQAPNLITAFGGAATVGSITLNATGWTIDPSVRTGVITPTPVPGSAVVYTDLTLQGNGQITDPLGLASRPIGPELGGLGINNPNIHSVCIGQGLAPFSCIQVAQDEYLTGTGDTSDPVSIQGLIIGRAGHLQIRNNPPAVDCPGSTGTTIVGNDSMFQVAIGSGTVTTCTVTFNVPMPGGALCKVSTSIDTSVFSAINPIEAVSDPIGNFVTLQGQATGADIGCHTATVLCAELVQ